MTRTQEALKRWIDKNFAGVRITYPSDVTATITDKSGESMTVTMNLFGDIMEHKTSNILAESDLPHDLGKIGYKLPTTWTELPYPAPAPKLKRSIGEQPDATSTDKKGMWIVENIDGDDSIVKKEFKTYQEAKAYSEWTLGGIRYEEEQATEPAKQRLFVDMDGTLAVFRQVDTLETLYEEGYFLNLPPHENVVEAIKNIINGGQVEVFIMSSVLGNSQYALPEKDQWLDRYLPEIDEAHRIYPLCGDDKKEYVPGGVRSNDFLLDDYTNNLTLWQPPARGIKLLNGINNTKGTWQHDRLDFQKPGKLLAENIVSIMTKGERIQDQAPQETAIINDVKEAGFQPTEKLVKNMMKLDELTGAKHSLKDVVKLYRGAGFHDNEKVNETVLDIAEECKQQELSRIARPLPAEPAM